MTLIPQDKINSFWSKVVITADDNQCWLWTGNYFKTGYGFYRIGKRQVRAHRIAWSYPDYVILDGMHICHSCDNPKCCNPKYLFIGTDRDNTNDKMSKNRQAKGKMFPQCVLDKIQVENIRFRYSETKITQRELANEYGVDQSLISYIVNNKKRKNS